MMKKVIEVAVGGISFTMDEDAYFRLHTYLQRFEETIPDKDEAKEVMEDVEARVAEIFQKEKKYSNQVIDIKIVQIVIDLLGNIETSTNPNEAFEESFSEEYKNRDGYTIGSKKLYRDVDNKVLGGVCSGLSAYFTLDVTLIRVIFALSAFFYGITLFLYIVLWLAIPKARYVIDKLRMRGYAPTAENIKRYNYEHK